MRRFTVLRIAVDTPVRGLFEYLPPPGVDPQGLQPGVRIRVPLGRASRIGVLLGVATDSTIERKRLRAAGDVLDSAPLFTAQELKLLEWASGYYRYPIGAVILNALPAALRRGRPARLSAPHAWSITAAGRALDLDTLRRAPRQRRLLQLLKSADGPLGPEAFAGEENWRRALQTLLAKGWASRLEQAPARRQDTGARQAAPGLTGAQERAARAIAAGQEAYAAFVLDGVTGSGKTEVYLQVIESVLRRKRQALVLIPEIALSKQTVERLRARFADRTVLLHSNLSDSQRLEAWLLSRAGEAQIIVGTRSAIWTPLRSPGVIIVDEEHDLSYKQQEGFRYHARDVAVYRARALNIPVILGSATPSLETLWNVSRSKYRHLRLPERAAAAASPSVSLVPLSGQKLDGGLSQTLLTHISRRLRLKEQSLLFLNRRGYAPALICHDCAWVVPCLRCDANLVWHKADNVLRCHHCGAQRAVPGGCGGCGTGKLVPVGVGTEQLVAVLERRFPQAHILRVDRDSTRRRGALDELIDRIRAGEVDIIVGTQMLAKGHDFPSVTLVGVVDTDSRLYSADFRSTERLAQLLVQVAGRAGRADRPGEVLVQTHVPEHPLLELLLTRRYGAFAEAALAERREAELPPYTALVLIRAEANAETASFAFLNAVAAFLQPRAGADLKILGPIAAPMERRAGRHRAHLLLQAPQRRSLDRALSQLGSRIESMPQSRRVRWSLDVDPQELL